MSIRSGLVGAAGFLFLSTGMTGAAAQTEEPVAGDIRDLGNGLYQVSEIRIDKNRQQFSVPGVMVELHGPDAPLEFIAVKKGGHKKYEALLELQTNAIEFNLACILIGLDDSSAAFPAEHFDPKPVTGDQVELRVSWQHEGKSFDVYVKDLFTINGKAVAEPQVWTYTGGDFSRGGPYFTESTGSLIGMVHDTWSIIQHRDGLGLGAYGAIQVNHGFVPPPGTTVTLSVRKLP